jgi:hypothetical protein
MQISMKKKKGSKRKKNHSIICNVHFDIIRMGTSMIELTSLLLKRYKPILSVTIHGNEYRFLLVGEIQ